MMIKQPQFRCSSRSISADNIDSTKARNCMWAACSFYARQFHFHGHGAVIADTNVMKIQAHGLSFSSSLDGLFFGVPIVLIHSVSWKNDNLVGLLSLSPISPKFVSI